MDEEINNNRTAATSLLNYPADHCASIVSCLCLTFILLCLSGCLSMSGGGAKDGFEDRIASWVEEEEYGKAIAAINALDKNDVRYKRLNIKGQEISELAKEYESAVIKSGKSEMRSNDWNAVLNRYDDALKKLPDSQRLIEEYKKISTRQKIIIHKAEQKVLFAKGEMLDKVITYNLELAQVDPRNQDIKSVLKNKKEEAKKVSGELLVLVEEFLKKEKLNKAKKLITLAYKLNPDKRTSELKSEVLKSIKERIRKKSTSLKNAKTKKNKNAMKRAHALVSEFDRHLQKSNYKGAKRALGLLKKNSWVPPDIKRKEAILNEKLVDYIDGRLKVGHSYYKKENYQKALRIWQAALALQPKHKQAKEYIERVERVIKRLEVLKSKRVD